MGCKGCMGACQGAWVRGAHGVHGAYGAHEVHGVHGFPCHTSGSSAVEGWGRVNQLGSRAVSVVRPACSCSSGPASGAGQPHTSWYS